MADFWGRELLGWGGIPFSLVQSLSHVSILLHWEVEVNFLVGVQMLKHFIPVTLNPKNHPKKHLVKISLQPCAEAIKCKKLKGRQRKTREAKGQCKTIKCLILAE